MAASVTLGLITQSRSVFDTFLTQINEVFGDLIRVVGYCLDEQIPIPLKCDLCLVSYAGILDLARELTKTKVVVAHRTLNLAKLNEVFELKTGMCVLVVNNFKESAEETVELLETMGINHINLIPYFPGSDLPLNEISAINVAITPGMSSLVPPTVKRIIDIGNRLIDISTFIEINVICNFPMNKAHLLSARTVREIFSLHMEQAKLVNNLKRMNKQMQIILENINDGVMAINHESKVVSCNDFAKMLLKIPIDVDITGKPLDHFVPELTIETITASGFPEVNKLTRLNNTYFFLTKIPQFDDKGLNGVILILKEASGFAKGAGKDSKEARKGHVAKYTFSDIVVKAEVMRTVIRTAQKIATTDLPVLILGESGTGKELFAQAIHNASRRQNLPFVAINLAALPETLVESELFGYEEGSFTGARKAGKPGLFELADGGTIFLDEIGDISPQIQVKLLRVLEEKEIMRIGGSRVIPVNVRIIAATNQPIEKMVKEGTFRRDFYYRLCVLPLEVPPLRSRPDDIVGLGEYFFSNYSKHKTQIPQTTLDLMLSYDWPGNVRELKEMVRFCTQLAGDEQESLELFHQIIDRLVQKNLASKFEKDFLSFPWYFLSTTGNVREYISILDELRLAKLNGERIGRESLQRKIELRGIRLSEQQVRTRLLSLQKLGCVKSGSGRQGSMITEEGERLLRYLKAQKEYLNGV